MTVFLKHQGPGQAIFSLTASMLVAGFSATGVQAAGISITSYGHSALLIRGGGQSVLVNPFRAVGCAAGLSEPRVSASVTLASSELPDEGARIGGGTYLSKPGSYRVGGMDLEGFSAPHDRMGGRRFGNATIWRWQQ